MNIGKNEIYKSVGRAKKVVTEHGTVELIKRLILFFFWKAIIICIQGVGALIPTKNDRVVFGSKKGWGYSDNPMYVYEWMLENSDEMDIVWICNEKDTYEKLKKSGMPCEYIYSFSGFYKVYSAKVGCVTHNPSDLTFLCGLDGRDVRLMVPYGPNWIYLRHGNPPYGRNDSAEVLQAARNRFHSIIVSSEFKIDIEKKLVQHAKKEAKYEFEVTGYPRSDIFFDEELQDDTPFRYRSSEYDAVVLYAPAGRRPSNLNGDEPLIRFFPFEDYEPQKLERYLTNSNVLLLLRLHPSTEEKMEVSTKKEYLYLKSELNELSELSNVEFVSQNDVPATNQLLPCVDILIADYSSIYHDFLLMDRPILFVPYDYERFYDASGGFVYDYYTNLPGQELGSYDEFEKNIDRYLNEEDLHKQERKELRNKIYKYKDSGSRRRVSNLIKNISKD